MPEPLLGAFFHLQSHISNPIMYIFNKTSEFSFTLQWSLQWSFKPVAGVVEIKIFYSLDGTDINNKLLFIIIIIIILFLTFSFYWYHNIFPFISIFLLFIQLTDRVNSKLEEAVRRQAIYCHTNICDVVLAWHILYPCSTWLVTILVITGLAFETVYSIS